MSMCRRFNGAKVNRLIVSVPVADVGLIDELIRYRHPARGNRAEFVRLALAEKLERDTAARKTAIAATDPATTSTERHQGPPMALEGRIDELADLCLHWARNRRSNRTPASLKAAILQGAQELAADR